MDTFSFILLTGLVFGICAAAPGQDAEPAVDDAKTRVLLLTGGEIHDHKGIGDLWQGLLKDDPRYEVTRVEGDLDALQFGNLKKYDVLAFYWTLGELTDDQRSGLINWLRQGGAFVTFHSGGDSFRDDPAYRDLVGGYFITHPHYRPFQVSIKDDQHPITQGMTEFMTTDEQYYLSYDPRVQVLATALAKGEAMPVMWVKPYGKGKVFYCSLAHDATAAAQPETRELFLRGVAWAAGLPREAQADKVVPATDEKKDY